MQREQKDYETSTSALANKSSATVCTKFNTQKKTRESDVPTTVKPGPGRVRYQSGVTTTIVSVPDATPDDILASAGIYLGETDGTSRGGDGNKPPDTEANKPPDIEANKPPDTDVGTRADSYPKQTTENSFREHSIETHGNSLFALFFNKSDESANEEDSPRET